MNARIEVRGVWRAVVTIAALTVVAACEPTDMRVEKLETGATRDSVLKVLTDGKPIDPSRPISNDAGNMSFAQLRNVWRRAEYVANGHQIEIIYYSPTDEKWTPKDTVPKSPVFPVILVDGKVEGTGKGALETIAKNYNIPALPY